ncbi:glycosyltransferase family 39 protein [Nocardia goodfellowii]|uniref:4-amino-4-deoxy-L-arabinose transferase-like glycosyltransferase n=1 Tax=Nocardia goodfellowii TaxID=882446 RepID=A0ABS4QBT5_9NOCA|nr:glycosyltransferase family 39 protein [Nocardia goodfellowii]MBP2188600.1 4-amino-4-deoxy-L-arabinose transferase-like glycosyltransferase [Nocardia goodfellowii]
MTPPTARRGPISLERRPRWELPALALLVLGTLIGYLCNLSANGWANSFYSAAVQAGSQSWTAFFFGSSDAANSITVDKPPAALWLMELSVRAFGLNSWSILVPEVLLGVASVALLWATVRRPFGPAAGLLAGLVLAVTPVAALMFRFNNPEALLVFLMVAAAWAMTRAVADGRTRWLVLTGALIGFGFLTKQLQVLLVVPALALTYLIAGPPRLGKRVLQLLAAGASMIVAVELWPASARPWIGGSQHNSILELTLGYNGLGRLNGNEVGSVGGGGTELPPGGNGMWGSTGITRMFEAAQGGQIAWLLPAALVGLAAGILLRGKATRTDGRRAALILWGGWLLVTGLVFSYMAGIFHEYYTVALAPAVAALVGAGATQLWRVRERLWARLTLAAALGLTTATAWVLLSRSASFVPWLRWAVLAAGILATLAVAFPAPRKLALVTALVAAFAGLAGPVAYSVDTIASAHQGSIPTAGPNVGGRGGMRMMGGPEGMLELAPGTAVRIDGPDGRATGREGGPSGLLGAGTPSAQVTALLERGSAGYTWVAATIGAQSAAGYQLATELPVLPIGGFNGSDPAPTLEQFREYVAQGKIHYFIGGDSRGPGGGAGVSAQITQWVREHFTGTEVDGVLLYDLTAPR